MGDATRVSEAMKALQVVNTRVGDVMQSIAKAAERDLLVHRAMVSSLSDALRNMQLSMRAATSVPPELAAAARELRIQREIARRQVSSALADLGPPRVMLEAFKALMGAAMEAARESAPVSSSRTMG